MEQNYMQALDDIRKVAYRWVLKNITLTGRITVAKTFLLSKVSHIAAILPTPNNHLCNILDNVIYEFIRGTNSEGNLKPSIVTEAILYAPKDKMGLGMHRIKDFWNLLKLPWLRRLAADSSWKSLHREEVGAGVETFDPFTATESKIKKVCKATKNQVWREIYGNLLKCKQNLVRKDPINTLLCPIVGEPDIMKKIHNTLQTGQKALELLTLLTRTQSSAQPGKYKR